MTNLIVPPPDLAEEWRMDYMGRGHAFIDVAIKAVQWGADQELEACCEWLDRNSPVIGGFHLRIDRRPKPPSLKEKVLAVIENSTICDHLSLLDEAKLRRALEALND